MQRVLLTLLVVLAAIAGLAPPLAAKRGPKIIEEEDGKHVHLYYEEDPASQAWLYRPVCCEGEVSDEGKVTSKEVDLIVALHGAGGNPKNFMMPRLMDTRDAWCLSVAGHQSVRHERGEGFQWGGQDVEYVVAFVEHLLETYAIRKDRVIVWGHSAGGTMTLATLAHAPKLFAGGLTTAAPRTPDSRHKEMRICVFLGTEDPNWGGAGSVRAFLKSLEKKRSTGACAFFAVEGLGHKIPYDDYLGLGFDWILHEKARGGEANVPRRSRGRDGDYHHILVRHKGAEGAEGVKRSKRTAKKLLKGIKKEIDKGRAFFPFEAACHSEDENTASCGGGIDEDGLRAFLDELPALEPGEISEILSSKQGLLLVWRPEDADEEEPENNDE